MDDFHRMLAEFFREDGFDAIFIKQLPGIPNDDDGTLESATEEYPIRAIKMELFGNMAGSRTKLSTLIQEADQVLYVQPSQSTNKWADPLYIDPTSDRIQINEVDWKVVAVKEYNPSASNCVLYELYIKR
jgi:hypothetical protein